MVAVGAANPEETFAKTSRELDSAVQDIGSTFEQISESPRENLKTGLIPEYASWDGITEKLVLSSSAVGLFMMVPQILKNAASVQEGNAAALAILPWTGYSTGFLGNMLLLSYFVGKREISATFVQGIGASSTAVLLWQIYLAGYMPPAAFATVAGVLATGLLVNALEYGRVLPKSLWSTWQDLSGIVGLAVLPQVVWSTFSDSSTVLPGVLSAAGGIFLVLGLRTGWLSEDIRGAWAKASGWTATLLFMFMPIPQLQACFTRPESLAGISILAPILALTANGLMVPRALFTRDAMWFIGAGWGASLMGWGVLLSMVMNGVISSTLFVSCTAAFATYVITVFFKDSRAHRLPSPLSSLKSLFISTTGPT